MAVFQDPIAIERVGRGSPRCCAFLRFFARRAMAGGSRRTGLALQLHQLGGIRWAMLFRGAELPKTDGGTGDLTDGNPPGRLPRDGIPPGRSTDYGW